MVIFPLHHSSVAIHSWKTLDRSVSNETELCFTRPRRMDIQCRCPDNTFGRHVGLCVSTTHSLLPKILSNVQSEDYIILLIAPAFLQAPWFQTVLNLSILIPVRLPVNRRMLKQPLSHVLHPQSEALCLYVLT